MNRFDAVPEPVQSLPRSGAGDFVCHTPQPIPPVDDDDDEDEDDDRSSGGGNIDPDDDEFDDDDDDDEAPWTAVAHGTGFRPAPE